MELAIDVLGSLQLAGDSARITDSCFDQLLHHVVEGLLIKERANNVKGELRFFLCLVVCCSRRLSEIGMREKERQFPICDRTRYRRIDFVFVVIQTTTTTKKRVSVNSRNVWF